MKIIETISDFEQVSKDGVLTIGNFDGVHLGHQHILRIAREKAAEKKVKLIAMTFEPHPVAILYPEKAPGVLTPLKLKQHLLAAQGVDCLVVLKDSRELLSLSPEDFVGKLLVDNIQPTVMVEGENFNFGYGRAGTIQTLCDLGKQNNFEVITVGVEEKELSIGHSVKVSSTIIRNVLESGKVSDAAAALGRPYRLMGPVIQGRGKGRHLGFPTANMQRPNQIIPTDGVYAGFVEIADSQDQACSVKAKIPAAFSIGRAMTYGTNQPKLIEAHLLTENIEQLYGKWMAMDFIDRIREQRKFDSETVLAEQIASDCKKIKEILDTFGANGN